MVVAPPAEALNNRGIDLLGLKRYDEALASFDRALAIRSDFPGALSNRGNALQALQRYDEALASYDRALAIAPGAAEALTNRGNCLRALQRCDEALASHDKALAIKPEFAEALSNRGASLQALKRYDEAIVSYDQALTLRPDYAKAHFNASLCRLVLGDFEHGWRQYEWRWKFDDFPSPRRDFSQPLWLGKEDITGRTILLHAEQGLGDTIQFARYAQAVAKKGARVLLEVPPALVSLLAGISGASQVLRQGERLPRFDFHCPLMSLPLAFGTRLETIPSKTPYLRPAIAAVEKWEGILGQRDAPRVGIVWSGNRANANDGNRSLALARLMPLASAGVRLISLQNEVRPEDETVVEANRQLLYFGSDLRDFSDTAALVSLMDLVISVDTSVAHLAGALGKPVWILLPFSPDWRWLADRDVSPWYPTARLFRQSGIGGWDGVIDRVRHQLGEFIARRDDRSVRERMFESDVRGTNLRGREAVPAGGAEAQRLADEGEREIRARNFAAAEQLLSRAARNEPGSARIQHLLGVSVHEQGRHDRAIACYRKAIKLDSSLPDVQRDLGAAYMDKRRYDDALACYQAAIRQNPNDELACSDAASALREMGDLVAARKHFQRALWLKVKRLLRAPWDALLRLR